MIYLVYHHFNWLLTTIFGGVSCLIPRSTRNCCTCARCHFVIRIVFLLRHRGCWISAISFLIKFNLLDIVLGTFLVPNNHKQFLIIFKCACSLRLREIDYKLFCNTCFLFFRKRWKYSHIYPGLQIWIVHLCHWIYIKFYVCANI